MKIVMQRSRIIFSEYDANEKRKIERFASTIEKTYTYEDEDTGCIYLPLGLESDVRRGFPTVRIDDQRSTYWEPSEIKKHNGTMFEPRNQMQIDAIKFTLDHAKKKEKVGLILPPGGGKGGPISMKLPSPSGHILMGDLVVGDRIFGSNGNQITVENIYELGEQDIYKVTFNDGRTCSCTEDHLWCTQYPWSTYWKIMSLKDMLKDFKVYQDHLARRAKIEGANREPYLYKYRIPLLSAPVEYDSKPVPLDPYTVGIFLGNGCCGADGLSLSCENNMIPDVIAYIHGFIARKTSDDNYTYNFYRPEDYRIGKKKRVQTKDFFKDVPDLIDVRSHSKRIPDIYLYNDLNTRLELLKGLMDTDGSISPCGGRYHVTYSSNSMELLLQMQELVRGLGFSATIVPDKRVDKYINGFHGTLLFNVPHKIKPIFFRYPRKLRLARKASQLPDQRQQPYKYLIIKDIQFSHREKARCIKVSAPDHLYLAEDFIVTHNTFIASYCASKVGLKTLIIAPTTNVRGQWVETLVKMMGVPESHICEAVSASLFMSTNADYVVALQATMGNINRNYDMEKILRDKRFGIKIIDEAHMFFHNIIRVDGSSNIMHNWYVTGTFGRSSQEEDELYHRMFGDINLFRVKNKKPTLFDRKPGDVYGQKPHMNCDMYWLNSGLTPEQVKSIGRSSRYGVSIPKYTRMIIPYDGSMSPFVEKLLKIIDIADRKTPYGRTLLLTPTIESVEVLATHIRKKFPNRSIGTIHSHNTKDENDRVKDQDDFIISTIKSSGTGFDVKDLSKLIVAEQYRSHILCEQVSGRLRRRPDGKETYMHDIVDRCVPQLRRWGKFRSEILKPKSKKFTVVDTW